MSELQSLRSLSPKSLAEELEVSVDTVYRWVWKKKIPYYKIGTLVRFNFDEVKNWLETKQINPKQEAKSGSKKHSA